jgi:tripeptidyl-peptidase I
MVVITSLRLGALISLLVQSQSAAAAVTLDRIANAPAGWSHTATPSDSTQMVLQVALAQQNIDQLEAKLQSVSTPGSASYGKYLDLDEINDTFGASNESTQAVVSWLKSAGVTSYTTQGDSIWFQTNVSTANSLLDTNFKTYTDAVGASRLRTTEYSIPESLVGHIDLIAPTTYFGKTKAMRAALSGRSKSKHQTPSKPPASCEGSIVYDNETYAAFAPDCIRTEYNVNGYTPKVSSGSKIAFGSFLNQSASFSDLELFEEHFNIPSQNFSVVLVNPQDGATAYPQPPLDANDGEANLDVQNIVSLVHPLPITEFITAGSPPYIPDPVEPVGTPNENEPYLPYYEFLLSLRSSKLPQVITNSYGDEEQTVPEAYAIRTCNLIGLLGLRGVSVLESSGDEGVGASCLSSDGKTAQFNPVFPVRKPSEILSK